MATTSARSSSTTSSNVSRTPLLGVVGVAISAVLTAIGTFWDVTGNDHSVGKSQVGPYFASVGIAIVGAVVLFGLVVRGAERGRPGRRSAILGGLGVATCIVFWTGLPPVLALAAIATALADRDIAGRFGGGSKAGLALAGLALAGAAILAFIG